VNLENLDLSFNKLKHIKRISNLTGLKNLYFVQNRISRFEGLDGLSALRNLELGANRIRVCFFVFFQPEGRMGWLIGGVGLCLLQEIDNIGHLTALQELWLGKNKITELKVFASSPYGFDLVNSLSSPTIEPINIKEPQDPLHPIQPPNQHRRPGRANLSRRALHQPQRLDRHHRPRGQRKSTRPGHLE